MDQTLVIVFLSIIALTSLLQAGFVAALAIGARMGGKKVAELEETFEEAVVPQIRNAVRLADRAAGLSEKGLAQAHRVDSLVAEASRKAERFMDEAADRVEGAVGRAADRVDAEMAMRAARVRELRILRKLSSASAFVKGVRRAVEVWQESADQEDDTHPDGGPPPDPSPA